MTREEVKKVLIDGHKVSIGGVSFTLDYLIGLYNWDFAIIKPKTIKINGFEVPEPAMVEPENGTNYYIPRFDFDEPFCGFEFYKTEFDLMMLKRGIIHLTKEAAELHARALLSFTAANE